MLSNPPPTPQQCLTNLRNFLASCSKQELIEAFSQTWLNKIIPGVHLLIHCDQGTQKHLEGNVAIHTSMVFENISKSANARLGRQASFIEKLAAVLHDLKKPATRFEQVDGDVNFPMHEAEAAKAVEEIAATLGLSQNDFEQLYFMVANHGNAHSIHDLKESERNIILRSPWVVNLALLQEADAKSCILKDGGHLPVYWDELTALAPRMNN